MAHAAYQFSGTFTNGSAIVTAALAAFVANAKVGDLVRGPDERLYFVSAVNSNTQITLSRNYVGTTTTAAAELSRTGSGWNSSVEANVRLARIEESLARGYTLQSDASLAIGAGSKIFTNVEPGLNILDNIRFEATSRADPANKMRGHCTYAGSTLTMTVPAGGFSGSGTFADWNLNIIGADGATGAQGAAATTPGSTTSGYTVEWSNGSGTALGVGYPVTSFAKTVLDDANAAAACATLGAAALAGATFTGNVRLDAWFGIARAPAGPGGLYFNRDPDNPFVLFSYGAPASPTGIGQVRASGASSIIGITDFTGAYKFQVNITTGAARLNSYGAGTLVTDASGNITASSDERLKRDIEPFERGLDAILEIEPISFSWTQNSGLDQFNRYSGFSAQNIDAAIPEAIGEDGRGYLTVSDRPILAALVNAIKEQQEVIAGLLARVTALELEAT